MSNFAARASKGLQPHLSFSLSKISLSSNTSDVQDSKLPVAHRANNVAPCQSLLMMSIISICARPEPF